MNVVAINSSPKMDKGNTALIMNPFLDGMREGGADVEVVYTHKMDVKPCIGCLHCWMKDPGRCFQEDDMAWLMPKVAQADVLVLATPVYVDGMTGQMKIVLDRMMPASDWKFELRDGRCRHSARAGFGSGGKLVLISNCAFWSIENFDPLLAHVQAICTNMSRDYAGALLRPHGPAMQSMIKRGMDLDDVFAAARDAGRQTAEDGAIKPDTLSAVSRELVPLDTYVKYANIGFERAAAKKE
jgi:multimeric flavodoxin WrbA